MKTGVSLHYANNQDMSPVWSCEGSVSSALVAIVCRRECWEGISSHFSVLPGGAYLRRSWADLGAVKTGISLFYAHEQRM